MFDGLILIMVDECGDEVEVERYNLHLDLDEDELEIWKERKINKACEEYPEARGFYFEDRRAWSRLIALEAEQYAINYEDEDDLLDLLRYGLTEEG